MENVILWINFTFFPLTAVKIQAVHTIQQLKKYIHGTTDYILQTTFHISLSKYGYHIVSIGHTALILYEHVDLT